VRKVVAANPGKLVTCEVESLDHALEAAAAGAHWLLIDNQPAATGRHWAQAVRARFPHVKVEASGGIRPDTVLDYGWADRVSLGWLTQKASGKDLSMEWDA
jgi:nicotinate-nucleotide pyrophosphorylase (carboxylating)